MNISGVAMHTFVGLGWLTVIFGWLALLCLGAAICDSICYWRSQARTNRRRWSERK